MPLPGENDPVADDEILHRRVPDSQGWIVGQQVSWNAFKPRPDDGTSLSLYRAKFLSLEDAARGLSKHGYYVLALRAGNLRAAGIDIVPRPNDDLPRTRRKSDSGLSSARIRSLDPTSPVAR